MKHWSGQLEKMRIHPGDTLSYFFVLDGKEIPLTPLIGSNLTLKWNGKINCCSCGKATNKSFNQGYCYGCFTKLAECDQCIMSPEKCHFHLGTCRDPGWGERICFNDHIVYLANSSGLKVGITRMKNMPSRWLDQGAVQALPIARTASRFLAGKVEDTLRQKISDKTNWRAMLKENAPDLDLLKERDELLDYFSDSLSALENEFGKNSLSWLQQEQVRKFNYPVTEFPTKVVSHNLDKTAEISGTLMGIKGQYLMLNTGVINVRKFTSYHLELSVELNAEERISQGQLAL